MPKADNTHTTPLSRRTLAGAAAAALALLDGPARASAPVLNSDAALIAAARDYARLWAEYGTVCEAEDDLPEGPEADALGARLDAIGRRMDAAEDRLCALPARTLDGLRAKAEVLVCRLMPWDVPLASSLVRDLLGRA